MKSGGSSAVEHGTNPPEKGEVKADGKESWGSKPGQRVPKWKPIRTKAAVNVQEVGGSNPSPRTTPAFVWIWNQRVGVPSCPYLVRWAVGINRLFSIRLHHWLHSDDLRHPHDHPWDFVAIVLRGTITDRAYGVDDLRRWLSCRYYRAEHRHSVVVSKPAWTLILTGPDRRRWGYWVNGRFRKRNKYYFENGHHDPCG